MKRVLLPFLLVSLVCLSCEEDDPKQSFGENDYFPLKVGNYWHYECANAAFIEGFENEITGIVTINNLQYYAMTTTVSRSVDTTYFRMDKRGYVFEFKQGYEQERNKFRLNAHKLDSWEYTYGPSYPIGKMTFNGTQNVTLNATMVNDCKGFSFDIKQMADEENYNILATGLGVVVTGGELNYRLTRAVINNQEFNF
jgi:hypothetical protein